MQRTLRRIKNRLDKKEYKELYPADLVPCLVNTTAKLHKLQRGEGLIN